VVLFSVGLAFFLCPAALGCDRHDSPRDLPALASASASASTGPAAQTSASPPPYDLASDIAARTTAAREEFGASTPMQVVGGVFLFVSADAAKGSARFEDAVRLAGQAFPLLMKGRFDRPPDRAVTVYAFSSEAEYDAHCMRHFGAPCDTPFGAYHRSGRFIGVNLSRGVSTVTHEMVHPIVQTDFPRAPAWIDEGLGALFEMPRMTPDGEIHGEVNWRLPELKKAIRSAGAASAARLEALFALNDAEFRRPERALLHEAMARYFCQWLDEQGLLWPFYRGWRDAVAGDPTGEGAFRRVVGKSPAEATEAWRGWVMGLTFQGMQRPR
jgi:hypothetical protein